MTVQPLATACILHLKTATLPTGTGAFVTPGFVLIQPEMLEHVILVLNGGDASGVTDFAPAPIEPAPSAPSAMATVRPATTNRFISAPLSPAAKAGTNHEPLSWRTVSAAPPRVNEDAGRRPHRSRIRHSVRVLIANSRGTGVSE